jgi:hypothetical protein
MPDLAALKQKISSLEFGAKAIEEDMISFMDKVRIIPDRELIAGGTSWDPPDYLDICKFDKIDQSLAAIQRKIVRDYNE